MNLSDVIDSAFQSARAASVEADRLRESAGALNSKAVELLSIYNPGWVLGPLVYQGPKGAHHLFMGRYKGEGAIGTAIVSHNPDERAAFVSWLIDLPLETLPNAIEGVPELLKLYDDACVAHRQKNLEAVARARAIVNSLLTRRE